VNFCRASVVNGEQVKYFDPDVKSRRVAYSMMVIFGMIVLVLVCVSFVFYLQFLVNSDAVSPAIAPYGNAAVSILNAVQIILLNMFYTGLAINLNNQENHR
jgi:uncharacterized membrane protein YhaH (DUF805 family)